MRIIPNILTLLNLFLGCIIVLLLLSEHNGNKIPMQYISYLILIALFFDFMDGLIARKFNMESKLGAQLDSLADLISFGLVPGIIMYQLFEEVSTTSDPFLPLLGFLITLASAYRLANFNLSNKELKYFKGLPTPANTIFILSLMLIVESSNNLFIREVIVNNNFLIFITILSCYLLNSRLKLINLKFQKFNFKGLNKYRILLVLVSLALLVAIKEASIPIILVVYYIVSYFALRNVK